MTLLLDVADPFLDETVGRYIGLAKLSDRFKPTAVSIAGGALSNPIGFATSETARFFC